MFQNLRDEQDTLVGFRGTLWHFHAKLMLMLMLDEAEYVELDELDVLNGLKTGDVVILERYLNDTLEDRWLAHKMEGPGIMDQPVNIMNAKENMIF